MEVLPPFWIWQCHVVARRPIRHFSPVKFLAANTILLMRKWNHACSLLVYVISVITPGRQRALTTFRRYYLLKTNSVIECLRLRQIIDLLVTDKSWYFAVPRPIIANFHTTLRQNFKLLTLVSQETTRFACFWQPMIFTSL